MPQDEQNNIFSASQFFSHCSLSGKKYGNVFPTYILLFFHWHNRLSLRNNTQNQQLFLHHCGQVI